MAPYIINPMNPYAVSYDMFISFMYLVAYFSDIYVICFKYLPLQKPNIRLYQMLTTIAFVVDMVLQPFYGFKKQEKAFKKSKRGIRQSKSR